MERPSLTPSGEAPVEVVPYDPAWPGLFEEERRRLLDTIGPWLAGPVEHIGSTAIPGLSSKPVIDIMAGVASLEASRPALAPLAALDYCYFPYRPVTVTGAFGGETSFGGRGAGGDPTAVAVVSDVLGIARGARPPARPRAAVTEIVSSDFETPYYVRFTVVDRPGIIAALASVFAEHEINIHAILQEPGFPADSRPFVVSLDAAPSGAVEAALATIEAFEFHVSPPVAMPILVPGAAAEAAA